VNDGFQPALGLDAVQRMARIAGKRVAVNFQIMQKMLQGGARSGSEFFAGIVDSEKNAAAIHRAKGRPRKRSHTSRDCAAGCRVTACGASEMMASSAGRA
jgi:Xaa-Pro aminopeptidase